LYRSDRTRYGKFDEQPSCYTISHVSCQNRHAKRAAAFSSDGSAPITIYMAAEERKSFLLRVDPTLWAELEAWASDELRSVNGQVEYILRQAVQKRKKNQATEDENESGSGC
jgi:hypothetical protein